MEIHYLIVVGGQIFTHSSNSLATETAMSLLEAYFFFSSKWTLVPIVI